MLQRLPKALLNLLVAVPFIYAIAYPYQNRGFIQHGAILFVILETLSFVMLQQYKKESRVFGKVLLIFILIMGVFPTFYLPEFRLLGIYYIFQVTYALITTPPVRGVTQYFLRYSLAFSTSLMFVVIFQNLLIRIFPLGSFAETDIGIYVFYGPIYAVLMFVMEIFDWPNKKKILK